MTGIILILAVAILLKVAAEAHSDPSLSHGGDGIGQR
jgi:hypothetical protein